MNTFRTITGEGLAGALGFAVRPLFLEIALCVVEDHLTFWMASGYIDVDTQERQRMLTDCWWQILLEHVKADDVLTYRWIERKYAFFYL